MRQPRSTTRRPPSRALSGSPCPSSSPRPRPCASPTRPPRPRRAVLRVPRRTTWWVRDRPSAAEPHGRYRQPLPLRWVHLAASPAKDDGLLDRLLSRHPKPKRAVGAAARYSNLGYLILGRVISVAAGMPFTDYVHEVVLRPAGMSRTGYRIPPDGVAATGYVKCPRGTGLLLKAALPPASSDKGRAASWPCAPSSSTSAHADATPRQPVHSPRTAEAHSRILWPATRAAAPNSTRRVAPESHRQGHPARTSGQAGRERS